MEILVVIAIILVLAAITFPVITVVKQRQYKAVAAHVMKQLATATAAYASQNDNELPREDAKGTDGWQAAADPVNAKAWYNSLPKLLSMKTVGEFAQDPRDFYTKANLLYIPGATYPETDKKLVAPLFAVAINTKLQRKETGGSDGKDSKPHVKLNQIINPARTPLFLEQGLPSEKKSLATQSKYDGSCKGSARSFVARYGGQGAICFVDGHVEFLEPHELLTETGKFPFPQDNVVWTKDPSEDPNK